MADNILDRENEERETWGGYLRKNVISILVNLATLLALLVTLTVFIVRVDSRSIENEKKDIEQDLVLDRHEESINNANLDRAQFHATITLQYEHIVEKLETLEKQLTGHTAP